ncbi:MAG: hypothetical protein JW862_05175 [Anaerolineales bacterium]|nr:hypothetical protein [Anaerolineales bacterium]
MPAIFEFSERDWEQHTQNWQAWWAGELPRPLVMIENPVRRRETLELTNAFLRDWPIDQVLDYYQARLETTLVLGDAWPKWFPFYGAGVLAAFMGAELLCAPKEGTIWFEPAVTEPVTALTPRLDPHNAWWQRILALTQAAVNRWQNQICVGFTDLGGNLDVLASLRGSQNLLLDLYDDPAAVAQASRQATREWLQAYDRLYALTSITGRGSTPWAAIWAPGRTYMLQSDFCAMISPRMFEHFVLPDLAACCQAIAYPFYHLDGRGQLPHLDMLLSLEKLRGVQWIPGDGQPAPQDWPAVLQRIRQSGKLCQLYVTAAGALQIAHQFGGRGFAFYITDTLTPQEAQSFLETLHAT